MSETPSRPHVTSATSAGSPGAMVASAARLRWRAPELALLLADRASVAAARAGQEAVRLRAEVLAVFACNQLGRGASAGGRAVRALRAAQAAGESVTERLVRVELAACAADASAPRVALGLLQPVLTATRRRMAPTARAAAMVTAADGLARLGGGPEVASLLAAADKLYDASRAVEPDAVALRRGVVKARLAAHYRRAGDLAAAEASVRDGIALLDELADEELETGQVRGSLVVELVLALLDTGREAEAMVAAQPVLHRAVRPAGAPSACWLRLAMASRVHLPAGRHPLSRRLLGDAVFIAERHHLDVVLAECLFHQSRLYEVCAELGDAVRSLRAAHVAERRWRDNAGELRTLLAAEFGTPPPAAELRATLATAAAETLRQPATAGPGDDMAGASGQLDLSHAEQTVVSRLAGGWPGAARRARAELSANRPAATPGPATGTGEHERPPALAVNVGAAGAGRPGVAGGRITPAAIPLNGSRVSRRHADRTTVDAAADGAVTEGQVGPAGAAVPQPSPPAPAPPAPAPPAPLPPSVPPPSAPPSRSAPASSAPPPAEPAEFAEPERAPAASVEPAAPAPEVSSPERPNPRPDASSAVVEPATEPAAPAAQPEPAGGDHPVPRLRLAEWEPDREHGRHRSDAALADLLAEAMAAYEDGRRSTQDSDTSTDTSTDADLDPANANANAVADAGTSQRVAAAPAEPAAGSAAAPTSDEEPPWQPGPLPDASPSTEPDGFPALPRLDELMLPQLSLTPREPVRSGVGSAVDPRPGIGDTQPIPAVSDNPPRSAPVATSRLVDLPAREVWREPGTF